MRTDVQIVARRGRSPRIHAAGGIAVRVTAADVVHLVSSAATPLGGDEICVRVEVEPGARLTVCSVAATVALPARDRADSASTWRVDVADGGRVLVVPQPVIVAGSARHDTATRVHLAADAAIELVEQVQIGRRGESGGRWSGALHVDVADRPLLRHRLTLDAARRAVISRFRFPDPRPTVVSPDAMAVRMVLAGGGTLTTALAETVAAAGEAESSLARVVG